MEAAIARSTMPLEVGLRNIVHVAMVSSSTFLFGLSDGRVFYASVSADDVSVLQDFDASPTTHGALLRSLRYLALLDLLVAESADGSVWGHLRDPSANTFFPAYCVLECVDGIDVMVAGGECLLCGIQQDLNMIGVVRVHRASQETLCNFSAPKEVRHPDSIRWASSSLLAVGKLLRLALLNLDGTVIWEVSSVHEQPRAMPLGHCFSRCSSRSASFRYDELVAILTVGGGATAGAGCSYFPCHVDLISFARGSLHYTVGFSLLMDCRPSFMTWWGPWLVVGSPHGLDFYDLASGRFAQSTLEDIDVVVSDMSSQVLSVDKPSCDWFYQPRTTVCATSSGAAYLVQLHSVSQVIEQLLHNTVFQMDQVEALMQYGHSVGARAFLPPNFVPTVNEKSSFFQPYGRLIARCAERYICRRSSSVSSSEDAPNTSPSRASASSTCSVCTHSLPVMGTKQCFVCESKMCSRCAVSVKPVDLGLISCSQTSSTSSQSSPHPPSEVLLCLNCDGCADRYFLQLLEARRYSMVIGYLSRYQRTRCHKFDLPSVIALCIEQCFSEKKYGWCARLICRYVDTQAAWDTWIMNFSLAGVLEVLVDVLPDAAAETAGTCALLQLIKHNPTHLYRLLRRWKPKAYDGTVVRAGVEARLVSKQREASAACASCVDVSRSSDVVNGFGHAHGAAHAWYIDRETEALILSLHRLVGCSTAADVPFAQVVAYLQYYLDWAPPGAFFPETRKRSASLFENTAPGVSAPQRTKDLIDFWDLFTSNLLLPEFVQTAPQNADREPLLLALLEHHRLDVCKHIFNYEPSKSTDIVEGIVRQLEPEHPEALLEFLHQLTQISPQATSKYHQALAEAYLQFTPHRLLPFVKNRMVNELDWLRLANMVEQRRMFPELVYIIGRTGNDREAVRIALRCLRDVALAVEYVTDSQDDGLWEIAISHVIQSEELIGQFLDVVGDRYDPAAFLRRIPTANRLNINRLGPRLASLVKEWKSTQGIAESMLGAVVFESLRSMKALQASRTKAVRVQPYHVCCLCKGAVLEHDVVVGPRGVLHARCFRATFRKVRSRTDAGDHYTEASYRQMTDYVVQRRFGVRDIVLLFPDNVVRTIASFLGPYGRRVVENVSSLWRGAFAAFRKSMMANAQNLHATYAYKCEEPNCPSLENTVRTVALVGYGEYAIA